MLHKDMMDQLDLYAKVDTAISSEWREISAVVQSAKEMREHSENMITRLRLYGQESAPYKESEAAFIEAAKKFDRATKA